MLDVMYELPHFQDVEEVVITAGVVEGKRKPQIKRKAKEEKKKAATKAADSDSNSEPKDAA